jgi:iron complex outermembrane recepter protein
MEGRKGRHLFAGRRMLLAVIATVASLPGAAGGTPYVAADSIVGFIVDERTGDPVGAAQVRLREIRRDQVVDGSGRFVFRAVPVGEHTLVVTRIGYAPAERRTRVSPGAAADGITIVLRPTALQLDGMVVTGTARERSAGDAYQPTTVLSDARLRRALGATVSATLAGEPGLHEQYNGPAASQPVIRGMGGDRVLVLEDGQRTGDLYSTGADHAVAVDPLNATRVEVVRGPAGLLYGSNALGGVINVIRDAVPAAVPERVTGLASAQAESVLRGAALGATLLAPAGPLALRAEASGRRAGDTRTPLGVLPSTGLSAIDAGAAVTWARAWGHVGLAVREYRLDHGVPGSFAGEQIPGAHPDGVETESRRRSARLEASHRRGIRGIRALDLSAGIVHYTHDEIEGRGDDGEAWVGTQFDQLSGEAGLRVHHEHPLGGFRLEGAVGFEYRGRDLRGGGSAPGLRSAVEHAVAAFVYEEFGAGRMKLQLGGRFDDIRVRPLSTRPIAVGRGSDARTIAVVPRRFQAWSASAAALVEIVAGHTIGVNVARAFRAPSIGELFSDGPHLADYSYDVGNPALTAETGLGIDVFTRIQRPGVAGEMSAFHNRVDNFIYYEATGDIDPRFGRFPVFEARGSHARFRGAEGRIQLEPVRGIALEGTASYVAATRIATRDPLPDIPPLNGTLTLRYERAAGFLSLGWRGAAAQRRVPHTVVSPIGDTPIQPQRPTDGYSLWHAGAGLRWSDGSRFHTLTLNLHNVFDAVWRDHLSRTKEIAPQPGRNLQILYRVNL